MVRSIISALIMSAIAHSALANEESIKKVIGANYPKIKIQSISKTPIPGIYEIYIGGQIIYSDENAEHIFAQARLVDTKSKQDVTGYRLSELTKINFSTLPLEKAIKVVKGDGSRKLVVFSDVDCPYCKRLEQNELTHIGNVTIYTFLYPVATLHPDSAAKSKSIWCAPNRVQAWNDWIISGKLPEKSGKCDVPVDEIAALGKKIGVVSTPTMYLSDGRQLLGSQPYAEIEHQMTLSAKEKTKTQK